jgi:hypothetical protein
MIGIVNDVTLLKTLIQPLHQISRSVKLECLRNGMRVTAIDDNDMCRGRLTLRKGYFQRYKCRKEYELTLYLDPIVYFLRRLGKGSTLYISSNSSRIKLFYKDNGWVNYLIIRDENRHEPIKMTIENHLEAIAHLQLNMQVFNNIVHNMIAFGDEIIVTIKRDALSISTQKLNHAYILKPTNLENLIILTNSNHSIAIPTHLLKIAGFLQPVTNNVTIVFYQEGLMYLYVEETERYMQEFLISCRMV